MTWLYLPSQALTPAARRACSAYRSVPAPEASTSDLRWPNPDTVLWVTSSGTPLAPRRGWPGTTPSISPIRRWSGRRRRRATGCRPRPSGAAAADAKRSQRRAGQPAGHVGDRTGAGRKQDTDRSRRGRASQRAALDDAECVGLEIGRGEREDAFAQQSAAEGTGIQQNLFTLSCFSAAGLGK